jgi:hypothetical protein
MSKFTPVISGTDKTVGAISLSLTPNVDGTDVDTIVTIVKTNATIVDVDNLNNGEVQR